MPKVPATEAVRLLDRGELTLVDIRPPGEFIQAHPKGAISIPFSQRSMAERIQMVAPKGIPLILLADEEAQLDSTFQQLLEGSLLLEGVLDGWREASLPVGGLEEIPVDDLPGRLETNDGLHVLDVREPMEWEIGHVPGAILISLGELTERYKELPTDSTIAVICEAGIRSCTAASLLLRLGFSKVANVPEGTSGYRQGGYPLHFYNPTDN